MGLKFYHVLLRILPAVQPDLISDELLDRFIANVLSVFARQGDLAQKEDDFVYAFSQVGSKFKGRLANKLDQVKAVLFNMEVARFKPDRLLECYVNFGVAVQENEFAAEFKILAKQIADGTLPLKVPILKCYGRFADVWIRFAESEDERESVIKALLEAIPKVVSEFGQSGIFSEEEKQPEVGPERFPNTREEMRAEYQANDMQKITIPVLHRTPNHYVPKEHLTRVNPSGIIRPDNGELIKGDISRSHLYASQLLMLVIGDDGRFAKHAQSVLNAMLATYRVGFNVVNLHHTILGLLALVRPEMESSEFIKYIDIVLHTMAHEINTEQPMHEAVKSGLSDLFAFCFSLLEGLGVMKASTIKNAIDVYLLIYDFADPRLLDLHELIFYLITTWPRNAYEGIRQSNLADWLLFRIKKAKSQEQMAPCLYVFATCAVFYGIDFISMELCVDDPNEDEFESSDQYLARIIPHCRALYQDASKSDMDSRWMEKLMYVKFMRNFLILYAIYLVHNHSGEISLLTKVEEYDSDVLKVVIASEKSFDTGVPELNEYFRGLDLDGLCKALSLKRVVYSDEEDEPVDNVSFEREDDDMEINDE